MSARPVSETADAASLRARFDAPAPLTVGLEEELMLLDPETHDLVPRIEAVLERTGDDPRFKRELPAAQVEIALPPAATVPEAARALAAARRDLATASAPVAALAGAGFHPFAAPEGELNRGARYDRTAREYGRIARRQLVFALQVHVCVRGADRALAVHNALRSHLPVLAALAATAPFYAGEDTGLASVRPRVGRLLPRQGVPPVIPSWEAHAAALARLPEPGVWWWEVRPHVVHGTLEVRVPDTQPSVRDAAAIAAVVHALAGTLAERFDAGEPLPADPAWAVDEDSWEAMRRGTTGRLGERAHALLEELAPAAERLGCARELAGARRFLDDPTHVRLRELGAHDAIRWLGGQFGG